MTPTNGGLIHFQWKDGAQQIDSCVVVAEAPKAYVPGFFQALVLVGMHVNIVSLRASGCLELPMGYYFAPGSHVTDSQGKTFSIPRNMVVVVLNDQGFDHLLGSNNAYYLRHGRASIDYYRALGLVLMELDDEEDVQMGQV